MAKDLNWFKFSPLDWMTGRIRRESAKVQIAFLELMCQYWKNDCQMTIEQAELEVDCLAQLIKKKLIKTEGELIKIQFLDSQMIDIIKTSEKNSRNGSNGGRPVKVDVNPGQINFYVVHLYSENESFYKAGVTSSKVERRMNNIPYKYDIVYQAELPLKEAIDLENAIKENCSRYLPSKDFGGKTECYLSETELLAYLTRTDAKPNVNPKIAEKRREEKTREERENYYPSNQSAFDDISNNYQETEPQRNILTNRGWRSAGKKDTDALLFHFLESQANLSTQDKTDVKSHFRKWLNKIPVTDLQTLSKTINERLSTKVS